MGLWTPKVVVNRAKDLRSEQLNETLELVDTLMETISTRGRKRWQEDLVTILGRTKDAMERLPLDHPWGKDVRDQLTRAGQLVKDAVDKLASVDEQLEQYVFKVED